MSRGRVVLAVSTICFGCAAPPPGKSPSPSPAPAGAAKTVAAGVASSAPGPAEAPAAEPARLPIEFVPVARVAIPAVPELEVQSPVMGKRIEVAQAETSTVRLKTSSWFEGLGVVMLLDDYPPRVFEDPRKPIALAQLWPTHRELEPGLHRLFVALQLPDGTTVEHEPGSTRAPFAYLPFWVGSDDAAATEAMREADDLGVILLTPRGTFNGDAAADQVLLDYQVLGLVPGKAAPRVRAELVVERHRYVAELGVSDVRRIVGLPSGDHVVRVSLLGADGQPLSARYASASRVITVNRDAPVQ